ncbi:MAG: glycosyltransferase, partial [Calditrichota bacterium]
SALPVKQKLFPVKTMDFFAHNAVWLQKACPDLLKRLLRTLPNPRLEVFAARSGQPSARHESLNLHSSYDPVSEGLKQAREALEAASAGEILAVEGLGLGYLAESLREGFAGKIAVLEPSLEMAKTALSQRQLDCLKAVIWIVGQSVEASVEELGRLCGGNFRRLRLVPHGPSVKLHSEWFQELDRLCGLRRNLQGGLSILVVTPMSGGSLPVAEYCIQALKRLGHRVETLDNSIYDPARRQLETISAQRAHRRQLENLLHTLMAESITARALDRAVDLVFLTAQSPITPPVLQELRARQIPVAYWFIEDWQVLTYWREIAPQFDYFFTIQQSPFLEQLARLGVKNCQYLPLAADPHIHRPLNLTPAEGIAFGSDISHVGAGYRNRRQVFSSLTDFDFKLWGTEWDADTSLGRCLQRRGERIPTEDAVRIFNASKINLNLHSSPFHNGVNPEGDYINPRTFEVAACGAFQLCDRRRLLPELFKEGEEIPVFSDVDELRELIKHYLAHPEERRVISERSRQRALREHTYELRMIAAMNYIYGYETNLASRRHPDHIDNLLAEAAEDADLKELLERFRDRGVLTLDDIIADLRSRSGELSRAELLFLLLWEFRKWAREKDLT